ncbi:MAG: MBL fold metallo-hydrolase [Clostridia bacterium]|nr:MBL fold metallo-hydrolase [Clostridia bacterium]
MTQLYPFCSSSKGNCTLLISESRALLIDCGVPFTHIKQVFDQFGLLPEQLDGILLTHEHTDHIKAIPQLQKRWTPHFYGTEGTLQGARVTGTDHQHEPFYIGSFRIVPIRTSHDVADPCGYRIEVDNKIFAIVTDTGKTTPDMLQQLSGCSLIMLESNYDPQMLECGPYPASLKRRVRSDRGHLSNGDCAALLALKALEGDLKTVVLAHLSDQNNTPMTAKMAALNAFSQYGVEDIRLEVGGPFCPIIEV